MPSAYPRSALTIRPRPVTHDPSAGSPNRLKHRPCNSYPEHDAFPLGSAAVQHPSRSSAETYHDQNRPTKRPMPAPSKTIAVINASGRQAASFIRVAVAVGYKVRAQLRNLDGIVATEIRSLPNVTVLVGDLYTKLPGPSTPPPLGGNGRMGVNHDLITELYTGAQLAFINTTFYGDEVEIGKALADEAIKAGIEHYIYSSMPNHSLHDPSWPSLPLWSSKAAVENYIRSLPALFPKATFLYTGIYNNNFTSLPYPLFCMELERDGSFTWTAPFHPDVPLPWLDAEHDIGPAVLQLIKDGISRWGHGERIALAYEVLTPREACRIFSRGVGRPVRYKHSSKIDVFVKIPNGYREQLLALERLYAIGEWDGTKQPYYFGTKRLEDSCPHEALELWEGYRGLEEYAREVFPLEEAANGLTWMNEGSLGKEEDFIGEIQGGEEDADGEEEDDDDEGLVMGGGVGPGPGTGGESTPARREEGWLA